MMDYRRGSEADIERYVDLTPTADFLIVQANAALAGKCESPIEYQFGAELIVAAEKLGYRVEPQCEFGGYRYDFAIYSAARLVALIECDGKEFHSSPEQIANDENKDRAAVDAGTRVLRLKGAQIYRSARKCAEEIVFRVYGT